MKNQIIPLNEKNKKVFGFNDEQLIFSSKKHKTFVSLLQATEKSGMLESLKTIPLSAVKSVEYNEKDDIFLIRYDKNGKLKKEGIALEDNLLRSAIVQELAALKGFNRNETAESKTTPLLLNIGGVLLIAFLTYIFRGMAVAAEHGEHFVAKGRRSGLKQLLGNAVEAIGPTGVTIIGVLGFLYMIYVTYNRYNNPAKEIKYT